LLERALKDIQVNCEFSFIIPVFREQAIINSTIENVHNLVGDYSVEIIVVDGHPDGGTIREIQDGTVKKIISEKGRGNQLNKGASIAEGSIMIFLHADSRLPAVALERIFLAVEKEEYVGGAFDLAIDSSRIIFRIIEKAASWRSRLTRIPYGDQAIFIRTSYFKTIGGFSNIPIMEDVEFMQRIKRNKGRIVILEEKAVTSPRRWEQEGVLYCTVRNWFLITLFFVGVTPEKLVRYYR
jgi:rSAM/selenodomain-associated transferase 2